jgi:hypothetical protein
MSEVWDAGGQESRIDAISGQPDSASKNFVFYRSINKQAFDLIQFPSTPLSTPG